MSEERLQSLAPRGKFPAESTHTYHVDKSPTEDILQQSDHHVYLHCCKFLILENVLCANMGGFNRHKHKTTKLEIACFFSGTDVRESMRNLLESVSSWLVEE